MTNKQITTSSFYDFCQKGRWKFRFLWKLQSILFRDVSYYYDKEQEAYCRKVKDVKGEIVDGYFIPQHNLLVNYRQAVNEYFYKNN